VLCHVQTSDIPLAVHMFVLIDFWVRSNFVPTKSTVYCSTSSIWCSSYCAALNAGTICFSHRSLLVIC